MSSRKPSETKSRGMLSLLIPILLVLTLIAGIALLVLPPALQDKELTRDAEEEEEVYQRLRADPGKPVVTPTPAPAEDPGDIAWDPFPDTDPFSGILPPVSGSAADADAEETDGVLRSGSRFGRYSKDTDIIRPVDDPDAYNDWLIRSEATPTPSPTPAPTPVPTPTPRPGYTGADLDACLNENSDFIAWIKIPGTNVDYPIVQTNDTAYYLNHTFSGKQSSLGTLFSLGKTDWSSPARNIAVYGHDVEASGHKMFNALLQYKKESFWQSHSEIYLDSLYHAGVYQVFAVFDITLGDFDPSKASFAGREEFQEFISQAKELSLYDTGVDVPDNAQIISLITCDRYFKRKVGRFVVMAVKIR